MGIRAKFDAQVITAGIYAGGTTTGDPVLLKSLQTRRANMLLAVDTALETLIDASRRNVPRAQLVNQFKKPRQRSPPLVCPR
ncbi:MAG: hypothetical protein HYX27_17875 [Acidobacteria bacterium]|nr:hypothetical protein [Acidobacteriota bacterium]